MVFKCQENSFLKEFTTKVLSCEEVKQNIIIINGKKEKVEGYEVILEDTIIFPEGGGQPCDHGYLNEIPVKHVVRKQDTALHYVNQSFNIGDSVKQTVDWQRRFDHMQQHSGQHLITAIIDREFKFPTLSWWLGEEVSYVELVKVYTKDTPEEQLKEARSARGLPVDHKGDIRVIIIEDVESNMCCGTHVQNLSQLQVIKLLRAEKNKNKTLLYFLVGNRVINRLDTCIDREQKLTVLLKKEAEPDFMNMFIKELGITSIFLFLSTGDENSIGNIVLYGEEKAVSDLGDKVCKLLEGKGAGKGNRFQAKVSKMINRKIAELCIGDYFK
ncbi:hypothetical protein NQ314_011884 [Rhamnusium bicolor]|uniref:Threonyl/alanyl tRNA synthetase SAD domain-containing protein n=1 Tax=Rhamnusium bicolor TaxID=1586634 RepID=A0AAV8XEK3_9CUCU|nr:hypothetical protein NQ314_011884 [Rhamnusium bicolor]